MLANHLAGNQRGLWIFKKLPVTALELINNLLDKRISIDAKLQTYLFNQKEKLNRLFGECEEFIDEEKVHKRRDGLVRVWGQEAWKPNLNMKHSISNLKLHFFVVLKLFKFFKNFQHHSKFLTLLNNISINHPPTTNFYFPISWIISSLVSFLPQRVISRNNN